MLLQAKSLNCSLFVYVSFMGTKEQWYTPHGWFNPHGITLFDNSIYSVVIIAPNAFIRKIRIKNCYLNNFFFVSFHFFQNVSNLIWHELFFLNNINCKSQKLACLHDCTLCKFLLSIFQSIRAVNHPDKLENFILQYMHQLVPVVLFFNHSRPTKKILDDVTYCIVLY